MLEKPVPDWPGWYAREDGQIRNGEIIVTGSPTKAGHLCFKARKGHWKYGYTQWVHRFVAKTWVLNPRPDIFTVVDHIDRNPQNNDCTNLRWVTQGLNLLNNGARNAYFHRRSGKWRVRVKGIDFGWFKNENDAIAHGQLCKKKLFEEIYVAHLNEPRTRLCGEDLPTTQ